MGFQARVRRFDKVTRMRQVEVHMRLFEKVLNRLVFHTIDLTQVVRGLVGRIKKHALALHHEVDEVGKHNVVESSLRVFK